MSRRIWDEYLSDRDRELARRQPVACRGLGKRPVLLMVDLYRNGFGEVRQPLLESIETWPASCGEAGWDALPKIQAVLQQFRTDALPVIHVTGLAAVPSWREDRLTVGRTPDAQQRARQFAIVDEVAPVEGEVVLNKSAPSAFWGTILPGLLVQYDADSLVVMGQATSGCVRATVVDACSYRYRVTVVEDCAFDRTEASHAINLFDMQQKYADVRSSADVLSELRS